MLGFNWFNMMHTFVVKLHLWLCAQVPVSLRELLAHLGTGPSGPSDENLRNYIRDAGQEKWNKRTGVTGVTGDKKGLFWKFHKLSSLGLQPEPQLFWGQHRVPVNCILQKEKEARKPRSGPLILVDSLTAPPCCENSKKKLFKSIGEKTLGSVFKVG